jgi:chromosome segregation protein
MRLKSIELLGFKSFAKKTTLEFSTAITAIVGPNGSGKSNIAESFRFVLGEQSMKSMRGKKGEDMIWNGSQSTPRGNRASVKLVFDNTDRSLGLDFDQVQLERAVNRDGSNEYSLNGSGVRLRDIAELLSGANIGSSGHHIISQGEADRILSASSKERREMIEDALGLTAYLYKREEAHRKLEKTAENIKEVEGLRRELIPHIKFLSAQVKKIEESQSLRDSLFEAYAEYLKRESTYLRLAEAVLLDEKEAPVRELESLNAKIAHLRETLDKKGKTNLETHQLIDLEGKSRTLRVSRDNITRELGRIEGELVAREHIHREAGGSIPAKEAHSFAQKIEKELGELATLQGESWRDRVLALLQFAREFAERLVTAIENKNATSQSVEELKAKKGELERTLETIAAEEEHTAQMIHALQAEIENEKDANREAERELFAAMAERSGVESMLASLRAREDVLTHEKESYRLEYGEAGALFLRDARKLDDYTVRHSDGSPLSDAEIFEEERASQESRRRALERMKIRLEEIGAGNQEEILKEHEETTQRDQFLMKELEDLALSTQKLNQLIEELTATLEARFAGGIEKINKEFDSFFKLMFGGGSASLVLLKEKKLKRASLEEGGEEADDEEDVEVEEGIDISVALPHKRVKGLHMLSGGERALTSIALIFAMSQVNPPPFLILDETDAALDEANSRRYGDMIENLAKKSQLILITHNRETMSRAGVLYGVTVGSDAVSKLLSIRFEEALAVAK